MAVIVFFDSYTKEYALVHYSMGKTYLFWEGPWGIVGELTYVENFGTAFGFLSSMPVFLKVVRTAIVLFCMVGALVSSTWIKRVAFAFVASGGLGNLWEVYMNGYVIDMVHFMAKGYSFPVFNVADCAICLGVILLLLEGLFHKSICKRG